jgi:GT2 family glycosyltransferase
MLNNAGDIDVEMLIWDNRSEDKSYEWAVTLSNADPRVTVMRGTSNIGMEAFNHLANEAQGQYIIKLDDDIEVPHKFAERLVSAYEYVNEDKLLFLAWDMPWPRGPKAAGDTFATRSGLKLYKHPQGKTVQINKKEQVLIHYDPCNWMANGACRLSPRDKFLEIGGHPEGIIYGVDKHASIRAAEHGYWIGYFSSPSMIYHRGVTDTPAYRAMKDKELERVDSPRDV